MFPHIPLISMFGVLKLVRIARLTSIINKLSIREDIKALIKVGQLVFYLFLFLHTLACFWWFIVAIEKIWVPPLDFIYYDTQIYEQDMVTQYWVSLYNAVLMLGGNEMAPRTGLEIFFIDVVLLTCAIINANIFGEMAVLVSISSRKGAAFQEQIDIANTAMKNMKVPHSFQTQVREFLIFTAGTKDQQQELKKFLDMISPSLKIKVAIFIFANIVVKNKKFKTVFESRLAEIQRKHKDKVGTQMDIQFSKNVEREIVKLFVSKLSTQLSSPEDVIVQQEEESTDMYIIAKGECSVIIKDEKKNEEQVRVLRPGEYFGEISLIYGCKRTGTVVSRKYSTLAKLTKDKHKEIITDFPDLVDELKEGILKYNDGMKKFIMKSIQRIDYLQGISQYALHEILYSLKSNNYKTNEILQRPGDDATKLFFLQEGQIDIFTFFEEHEFVIEKLYKGSVINYRTFFMEEDGQVYFKFSKNSIVLELDYREMNNIAIKHPDLQEKFLKYQKKVLLEGKTFPLDYIMNLPKDKRNQSLTGASQGLAWRLENTFKNVVMRRLQQIRKINSRPSLKDMIMQGLKKKNEKDERARQQIKMKVIEMFEGQTALINKDDDHQYNKVQANIDRLLKIMTAQTAAIDSLERKLIQLTKLAPPRKQVPPGPAKKKFEEEKGLKKDLYESKYQGEFPGINDDDFSSSSEEERLKRERLEKLAKIANQPKDYNLVKDYRLPIMTAQTDMKFDIKDSDSDEEEGELEQDEDQ